MKTVLRGVCLALALGVGLHAQTVFQLTPPQQTTLKTYIQNDMIANAHYLAGNLDGLALYMNSATAPTFNVYRSAVPVQDITDAVTWANYTPADTPDGTQLWLNRATAAQGKQFNLQTLLLAASGYLNAAKVNIRAGLQDATQSLPTGSNGASVSAGWVLIRDTTLARAATRFEKVYATTTVQQDGSTAAKAATLNQRDEAGTIIEGQVSYLVFANLP